MPKIFILVIVVGLLFLGTLSLSKQPNKMVVLKPQDLNNLTTSNSATPSSTPAVSPVETPTSIPTPTPTFTPTPTKILTPTPTTTPVIAGFSQMPGEGYHSGGVKTSDGNFTLYCTGGNVRTMRVVTDSASENDCKNDCPVLSVADYASRNNGFAAMNGMYFCPQDYPSCSDKKNSFDTLFFNSRVKHYLNSDNNIYSTIPFFVALNGGDTRFMGKTLEWGRDTNIQAGIAGNPMLIAGGRNVIGEYSIDDKQRNGSGPKGAIVRKGDILYLCVVASATVPQTANIYSTLGADDAMNIDGGGSAALWVNGHYIFGPGRNLPNAIIFAH